MPTYTGTSNGDYIPGSATADIIYGNGGHDYLIGGDGGDYIDGGTGNDTIMDNDGQNPDSAVDNLYGGDGDDLIGAGYLDNAYGGSGTDTLILRLDLATGALVADFSGIWSGASYTIDGAAIQGFEAIQWLVATQYDDYVTLGTPTGKTAELAGRGGADVLIGGAGNDILNADFYYSYAVINETDYDVLTGGGGDDWLTAGLGDNLDGGSGTDRLTLDAGMSGSGVTLNFTTLISSGTDTIVGTAITGIEHIAGAYGSNYADTIDASADTYDTTLLGRDGDDTLLGGSGANRLDGGSGADTMSGGAGHDTYIVDNAGDWVVESSGGGTDSIQSSVSFTLAANVESLSLTGSSAINATGNGLANSIFGNSGANSVSGGAGDDTLQGQGGADVLTGGTGRDVVTGGSGADEFVFADGDFAAGLNYLTADTIADFSRTAGDKIRLTDVDAVVGGSDNAFSFIGTSAFSGVAGQLRYSNVGGYTLVYGDTNGDGTADFMVTMNGTVALLATDFYL